jgi:hypothetical protein
MNINYEMKEEKPEFFETCFEIFEEAIGFGIWAATMALCVGMMAAVRLNTPFCDNSLPDKIAWATGLIMFGAVMVMAIRTNWIIYKQGYECDEFEPAQDDQFFVLMAITAVGMASMAALLVSLEIDRLISGAEQGVKIAVGNVASIVTFVGVAVFVGRWAWTAIYTPSKKA